MTMLPLGVLCLVIPQFMVVEIFSQCQACVQAPAGHAFEIEPPRPARDAQASSNGTDMRSLAIFADIAPMPPTDGRSFPQGIAAH
jgi:hypothetical protein